MTQNLLSILPKMSQKLRRDIAFAIRNFSECNALQCYNDYIDASDSMMIGFLDREMVEAALQAGYPKYVQSQSTIELRRLLAEGK